MLRYADAERDCSHALSIQGGNVKALYRRALARKGLEQYERAIAGERDVRSKLIVDLKELLKVEVGNAAALEELEEVETLKTRLQAAQVGQPVMETVGMLND